jgi:ribosomal protein S27AE
MSAGTDESPCPRCGEAVSVTVTTADPGDQIAASAIECPNCGASLVRAVEGHTDSGWRLRGDADTGDPAG